MDLQHLNVKLFLTSPQPLTTGDYYGVFNGWIQQRHLDELLVDVADYGHVRHGPGLVLVGHAANYSLDQQGGRDGLLYNRKARVDGPPQARLRQAVRAALLAARKLEQEQGFVFDGREVQIIFNDRLLAPNTPETLAALKPELEALFTALFAGRAYTLNPDAGDPRARLSVTAITAAPVDLSTLLDRLEPEASHAA